MNTVKLELYRIIRDYGEDKFAKNIARAYRKCQKTESIGNDWGVNSCYKGGGTHAKARAVGGTYPAKRTFQAIRIELNRELDVLENSLGDMIDLIERRRAHLRDHVPFTGGPHCKESNSGTCENPCTCPKEFPVCVCGRKSKGKVITRKPDRYHRSRNWRENSRAKSSKLRVFEREIQ